MPDISKLPQLAAILGVSVDGLLGAEEAGMVERAMDAEKAPLSVGELADIAPLLPPEEARRNFERTREQTERAGGSIDLRQLEELAPFLDEEDLGALALSAVESGCELDEIARLAPFMAEEDVGRAVCPRAGAGRRSRRPGRPGAVHGRGGRGRGGARRN